MNKAVLRNYKKELFFRMMLADFCKRKGVDFVILFCRYELKMTDKELKQMFSDDEVENSKRFNEKNYNETVKLNGGNIFTKDYRIYFGGKQIF